MTEEEHLGSHENNEGFLLGSIGDYFDSFEIQITKFNAMIVSIKRHWSSKKEMFE